MTEKEAIATVHKRIKWLEKRIAEADAKGRDLSFDKQEAAALKKLLRKAGFSEPDAAK